MLSVSIYVERSTRRADVVLQYNSVDSGTSSIHCSVQTRFPGQSQPISVPTQQHK